MNRGADQKIDTLVKQDPNFDSFRTGHYNEIAENPSTLFNFFYNNNDIFGFISPEDEKTLDEYSLKYVNRTFYATFGSMAAVAFIDKVVMRYAFPNFRIKSFRAPIFLMKYIGIPFLSFGLCKEYFCQDIDDAFRETAEKYNFNFDDYNKAMDILDRANRAGRLEELLEKGPNFDWSTVPGGRPSF